MPNRYFSRGKQIKQGLVRPRQKRHHFLDHRRIQRRGGVVIEVNEFVDGYHMLDLLMLVLPTTALVHHGRRQEFKVADLELAVFFDENDFEIEVGIKILALLHLLHADALSLGHPFKFLR